MLAHTPARNTGTLPTNLMIYPDVKDTQAFTTPKGSVTKPIFQMPKLHVTND